MAQRMAADGDVVRRSTGFVQVLGQATSQLAGGEVRRGSYIMFLWMRTVLEGI